MKPIISFIVFTALLQITSKAQPGSIKNEKPYTISAETIDGKKEKGVLYSVNEDTLELLPLVFKYGPLTGHRTKINDSRKIKIPAENIQSFNAEPKGATKKAIVLGSSIGCLTGLITGVVITPKADCTSGCIFPAGWDKFVNGLTGSVIGIVVGTLTGFLVGKANQKKFFIGGSKNKFYDAGNWLMGKTYYR